MKRSSTGYGPAILRAMENMLPEGKRLISDPYSKYFLTDFYRIFLHTMPSPKIVEFWINIRERLTPGVYGGLICRTRYIDDVLRTAIEDGFTSVVNLGAGMDTRAFRINDIERIRYFELDLPEASEQKRSRIEKAIGAIPSNVVLLPVDFSMQEPAVVLKKAGYDDRARTLFIWEGVTQYIPGEAVDATLRFVAQSAAGSRIVFTYIVQSFMTGEYVPPGLKSLYSMVLKRNNPLWLCGLDSARMQEYLSQFSLSLLEDLGPEEMTERYLAPRNRDLAVMEIERTALANVT